MDNSLSLSLTSMPMNIDSLAAGRGFQKDFATNPDLTADSSSGDPAISISAARSASTPATNVELQDGNALLFDGVNDEVTVADHADFNMGSSDFSIYAKFKTTDDTGYILMKGAFTSEWYALRFDTNVLYFTIDDGTTLKQVASDSAEFNDGAEHTVTGVRDGNNLRLYVDGVEHANSPTDITGYGDLDDVEILTIGHQSEGTGAFLAGEVYGVQLFKGKALSSAEALTLHSTGAVSGVTTHYDFVNTAGDLLDIVGSNDGTISGAQWLTDGTPYVKTITASDTARHRSGYYDATGYHASPRLVQEGAVTNMFTYSGQMDHANWSDFASGTTDTANVGVAPDGSLTATRLVGTGGGHYYAQNLTRNTNPHTISMWVKSNTGSDQDFRLFLKGSDSSADFTATTEWSRFSHSGVGDSIPQKYGISRDTSNNDYDILVWGAQLEQSSHPTTYIPTTSAALTRNQETMTIVGNDGNFPDHLASTALSFDGTNDLINCTDLGLTSGTETKVTIAGRLNVDVAELAFLSAKNQEQLEIHINADGSIRWIPTFTGAVPVLLDTDAGVFTAGQEFTYVFTFDADAEEARAYIDGAEVTLNLTGGDLGTVITWSTGVFVLGRRLVNQYHFDGRMKDFRLWIGTALSGTEAVKYDTAPDTISTAPTHHWDMTDLAFGAATVADDVGSATGTIDGATVVSTSHAGTIGLGYDPLMLPDEQPADNRRTVTVEVDADNNWEMQYGTNAEDRAEGKTESATTELNVESSGAPFSSDRNTAVSHIMTFDTTADASAKKITHYIDGVADGTNANYTPPIGNLPATIQFLPDDNCAIAWKWIGLWSRALTATEATRAHGRY